jgi:hypothetical protein
MPQKDLKYKPQVPNIQHLNIGVFFMLVGILVHPPVRSTACLGHLQ